MKTFTVTFTGCEVALMLRILLHGPGPGTLTRLTKATRVAAADLQRMANGELAPTPGVLSYLDFRRSGRNYIWQF